MQFWWLAMKDSIALGRDKKALLTLVFMPILLIGILGAAFGNLFSEEEAQIQKFPLGIVNLDQGAFGGILEKEVFEKGFADTVTVQPMESEKLFNELEEKKITVGLILPENFSASVLSGGETSVQIISIPGAMIQPTIVEMVVQQFSEAIAVETAGMIMAAGQSVRPDSLFIPSFQQDLSYTALQEVTVDSNQNQIGSFQYYAAGMGVMFLLMTVVTGVGAMLEEKEQDVYRRLLVTNLTHSQYLLGKLIGLLLLSTIQLAIIILGTSLLFDVYWGDSLGGIFLIGLAYVFSACGMGVLCGSLLKTEKAFSSAGMLGTQILAAAGGSMVPLYVFPEWLNEIVRVFPNALALQSFIELMSGEMAKGVFLEAAMLFTLGLVFMVVAFVRLTAERRKTYA